MDPGEIPYASPVDAAGYETLVDDLDSRIPLMPHQCVLSPDDQWLAGPLEDGNATITIS